MALSEKELERINRHCICGLPNCAFIKNYKWRYNDTCYMKSIGIFLFCKNESCTHYYKKYVDLQTVKTDQFGGEHYFTAIGLDMALDNLAEVW